MGEGRAAVLEPSTVEVVYRYLVAILRAAVADKLIVESPCRGVKLPKVEQGQIVPLATEVVEAIATNMARALQGRGGPRGRYRTPAG